MKSKVKKHWVLMIFQFFCSPFFQWNGYFQCQCTTHDITAHRPIFAHTAAAACLLLLKSSSDVKCKVRNLWVLIIFQFFCLPFLQWNSTFSAHAPHMISQPIDQFLPCCCRCLQEYITIKQQCKKNGEKPSCFFIAQSFYSPFLSNCWFWGEHMICGCHGNCGWDNCSSCSAATAAAATVAVATEATAAAATLAAVMVAAAMATIFAQLLPPLQCIAQSCRALQKEQWVFDMIWFFYNVFHSPFFYN